MLYKVDCFYLCVVDHSLNLLRNLEMFRGLSNRAGELANSDFENAKRLNILYRLRCFNQKKMETFASYTHLGTNQAQCSSRNSIYWLNLNCTVRNLSCKLMHAKQNSANMVNFVQTFLDVMMILCLQ